MRIRFWNFLSPTPLTQLLSRRKQRNASLFHLVNLSLIAALAVVTCSAALAQARTYNTVVVFGDSLSDTGNVTHLSVEKYGIPVPGPILPLEDYTFGRFTDGADSKPTAQKYFGVWVEQLAARLPGQPLVLNSLDGGTNYAYGFATTANGTSPLFFTTVDSVQVENIGQQITDYLATHPHIDNHTLFVVWGGAIDLLSATSSMDVFNAAARQTNNLERLIQAGATQFLVPNLPPLGLVPRLNGSLATSVPANAASALFNSYLAGGITLLKDLNFRRHLTVYQLDVFHLFLHIVASPGSYSLANVTGSAEGLQIDPDTYLFWDDLHPTTRGHNILADAAIEIMSH